MNNHSAWVLVCRLFASGVPVLRSLLSAREKAALPQLGHLIKPAVTDQSYVLCPHCQLHCAQVWSDGRGGRLCRCPDCGPVSLEAKDTAALALDEPDFRRKMRYALEIESRDDIDDLGDGVWRLGDARRSPVLLARDLTRIQPGLLGRVQVAGGNTRVITPRSRIACGSPFGPGVEWLVLEECFMLHGAGISCIAKEQPVTTASTAICGPFSADFKWATLPHIQATPIRFTDGQAKIFAALWELRGEAATAERIMQCAGLESSKPSELFKVKSKDRHKPGPEAQHAAYYALVTQAPRGFYQLSALGQSQQPESLPRDQLSY